MNTRTQTDIWINRIVVALALIVTTSAVAIIVMRVIGWPMPEILVALGAVAGAGLARLLISPLTRGLYD